MSNVKKLHALVSHIKGVSVGDDKKGHYYIYCETNKIKKQVIDVLVDDIVATYNDKVPFWFGNFTIEVTGKIRPLK